MAKIQFNKLVSKKNVFIEATTDIGYFLGTLIGIKNLPTVKNYEFFTVSLTPSQTVLRELITGQTAKGIQELPKNVMTKVNVSPQKVKEYTEKDLEADYQHQSQKYPHIDPERFRTPVFPYSPVLAATRDVLEICNMSTVDRPLDIIQLPRNLKVTITPEVKALQDTFLEKHGLKEKPFSLVEKGFCDCTDVKTHFPDSIELPSEDILNTYDRDDVKALFTLMGHPNCTSVGICSSFWIAIALLWINTHQFFVWDLDYKTYPEHEGYSYHVDHELISLVSLHRVTEDVRVDLAKSLMDYHIKNKESIEITGQRLDLFRPKVPVTERLDF
jgi:hypothetical protein